MRYVLLLIFVLPVLMAPTDDLMTSIPVSISSLRDTPTITSPRSILATYQLETPTDHYIMFLSSLSKALAPLNRSLFGLMEVLDALR